MPVLRFDETRSRMMKGANNKALCLAGSKRSRVLRRLAGRTNIRLIILSKLTLHRSLRHNQTSANTERAMWSRGSCCFIVLLPFLSFFYANLRSAKKKKKKTRQSIALLQIALQYTALNYLFLKNYDFIENDKNLWNIMICMVLDNFLQGVTKITYCSIHNKQPRPIPSTEHYLSASRLCYITVSYYKCRIFNHTLLHVRCHSNDIILEVSAINRQCGT